MPTPRFEPTEEQRRQVATLASLGIAQHEICNLIFHRGKPIKETTLKKHFREELTQSETRMKAQVGSLYMASILGRDPPQGTTPIVKEETRGNMIMFYMKNRYGWGERMSVEGGDPKKPVSIVYAPKGADQNL